MGITRRERIWIMNERINKIALNDLAYIAGFIDGEGSLGIRKRVKKNTGNSYHTAFLVIHNTYEPTMKWLQALIGGSLRKIPQYSKNKKVKHKDIFVLSIEPRILRVFLPRVLPYLKQKKEHAEILLIFLKTKVYGRGRPIPTFILVQRDKLTQQIRSLNERTANPI